MSRSTRGFAGSLGRRVVAATIVAGMAAAASFAATAGDTNPDRIVLLTDSESSYGPIARADIPRSYAQATLRLVVFRAGVPVRDHGLREESRIVPPGPGSPAREELRSDSAIVATDGRSAILVRTDASRPVVGPEPAEVPVEVAGRTELTWIDPEHPEGRWSMRVSEGRWVREIVVLPNGFGAAVSTVRDLGEPADLTVVSADGETVFRQDELEASVGAITATSNGAFLAVDLAFPARPGLPDRGVLVFDLLAGGHWTYAWSYGSEQEPSGWEIEDTGILVVEIGGVSRRYDRFGRPI